MLSGSVPMCGGADVPHRDNKTAEARQGGGSTQPARTVRQAARPGKAAHT